jgi:hypothetical protein
MTRATRKPSVVTLPLKTDGWRSKLHPLFVEAAGLKRKVVVLARRGKPEGRKEIDRLNREVMPELMQKAGDLYDSMKPNGQIRNLGYLKALGLDNLPPGTVVPEDVFMLRWLCWFRFGKTLETLNHEYELRDLVAIKQMNKLRLEIDMCRIGEVDPNKLKFKTDLDHFCLLNGGLDLGFDSLSAEELADCFDALCPCGAPHFPENLSKLRARILKEFPPISRT